VKLTPFQVSIGQLQFDKRRFFLMKINEDWLSVILGLGITVLVWIGILGKLPWPIIGFLK
jgi:hypothetical protein